MVLFTSFTGLLGAISRREVDENSLATGLFAFACDRVHALSEDAEEIHWHPEESETRSRAAAQIRKALVAAEAEGRVFWYRDHCWADEAPSRAFLARNGIKVDRDRQCSRERGLMPAVAILAGVEVM